MQARVLAVAVVVVLAAAACSDHPTAPRTKSPDLAGPSMSKGKAKHAAERAALLTDVPITGKLADGGTFTGTFTATKITVDEVTRQLTLTGVVNGTAMKLGDEVVDVVDQTFSAPVSINRPGSGALGLVQPTAQASCGILNLVLGPLHLDLLGLVVDLNQVILNVFALTGAGNLLGNLLCALTGLLDIPGAIAAITHILDMVNGILGGLTTPGVGGVMWAAPVHGVQLFST